jgi:aminoglycoside phosphotransferase (APT) family kinase protein
MSAGAQRDDLAALSALVGAPVVAAERAAWGFENRTDLVTLADGRRLAVQRLSHRARAAEKLRLAAELPGRFAAAGLRLPRQLAADPNADPPYAVREFIPGLPGAALMGEPDGAVAIARVMGALLPRLAAVDTAGLALDDTWADPARLAARARTWLAATAGLLPDSARAAAEAAIGELGALFAGRPAVFAHGDFCPVNVLLEDERRTADGTVRRPPSMAALLDVEFARLADPLFDVAWWGWVVRYHHEPRWRVAWPHLLAAAGLHGGRGAARRIRAIQLLRCLEMLAEARSFSPPAAAMWAERLEVTAGWGDED